jgi:hypothetical protein
MLQCKIEMGMDINTARNIILWYLSINIEPTGCLVLYKNSISNISLGVKASSVF